MNPSHDLQGLKKKAKETFLYALSALFLGIAIGAIDAVFGRVLLFITDFRSAHVVVLLPFLPLAGLGIVWLYRHFNETAAKGMTLVMEAGQGKRESIPLALIPLVMAGTWITHLFGGSAGREGVAVQIGATLSHAFARRFHFPDNGRIVLIAGMAAGFGGLFQTPFAAVFFAMEVVVSGSMAYSALLPAAIASFTASATSHALGLEKFSVLLSQTLSLTAILSRISVKASQFLEKWTGNSALDEYQTQDPNRVRAQVAAIYEALRSESLIYSTVPASFETSGQRIRLVDNVLTSKLGTCIDLTLLYASCLEANGIHPLLVLLKGHILVGAWLTEDIYHQTVGDDASFLLKGSANGISDIVLVETTALASSQNISFEEDASAVVFY